MQCTVASSLSRDKSLWLGLKGGDQQGRGRFNLTRNLVVGRTSALRVFAVRSKIDVGTTGYAKPVRVDMGRSKCSGKLLVRFDFAPTVDCRRTADVLGPHRMLLCSKVPDDCLQLSSLPVQQRYLLYAGYQWPCPRLEALLRYRTKQVSISIHSVMLSISRNQRTPGATY